MVLGSLVNNLAHPYARNRQNGQSLNRGRVRGAAMAAVRVCGGLALAGLLAGCTTMGLPFGPDEADVDTASTTGPAIYAARSGLATSDLTAIGSALSLTDKGPLRWSNPESGAQGSLTNIVTVARLGDDPCRTFDTTVNAVDGVRAMHGIACRQTDGRWMVAGLAPLGAGRDGPVTD